MLLCRAVCGFVGNQRIVRRQSGNFFPIVSAGATARTCPAFARIVIEQALVTAFLPFRQQLLQLFQSFRYFRVLVVFIGRIIVTAVNILTVPPFPNAAVGLIQIRHGRAAAVGGWNIAAAAVVGRQTDVFQNDFIAAVAE